MLNKLRFGLSTFYPQPSFQVLLMFLHAVVLLKVWECCKKFSKFCHRELASLMTAIRK